MSRLRARLERLEHATRPPPAVHVWMRDGADAWTLLRPLDEPGEPCTFTREQLERAKAARPHDVWIIDRWHEP